MVDKIKKFFKAAVFAARLRHQARKADRIAGYTGERRFVIVLDGKPYCVSKRKIRALTAQGVYKKGVKPEDIIKEAI
ncbi:MAG: hypothetical protein IJU13_07230, partial [Bacteroidales bacterium]|nr:hypothetical protein [Bacteroidales bacterium]